MRVHVEPLGGGTALWALLESYGITGLYLRPCGAQTGTCYVLADDRRSIPRD